MYYTGDALSEIKKIKATKDGHLDFATMPEFARVKKNRAVYEEKKEVETKQRPKTQRVERQRAVIEEVGGKFIRKVKAETVDEPVISLHDVYTEDGRLIVGEDNKPLKYATPVMEDYQEETTKKVKVGEEDVIERDLGAMISILMVAVQQLLARVEKLEKK